MSESEPQSVRVDGPEHIFQDNLLDNSTGKWQVSGTVADRPVQLLLEVDWVLNHQFIRLHFTDASPETGELAGGPSRYEAMVFIGYDNLSERYVAHWLDVFGGRFSEALGFGSRLNDGSIKFVFEYEGPLHNTLTWNAGDGSWTMLIRQKDSSGKWTTFAEEFFQRRI